MRKIRLFVLLLFVALHVIAQEDAFMTIYNPMAYGITLPIQNNTDFQFSDGVRNSFNFQPVFPITIGPRYHLITRMIIPVVTLSGTTDFNNITQAGTINASVYLTPSDQDQPFKWGLGGAGLIPMGSEGSVISGQWSAGPALALIYQQNDWTVGALFQNVWAFSISSDKTNLFYSQLNFARRVTNDWYINSSPTITGYWTIGYNNEWNVPLGLGVGKVFDGLTYWDINLGFYKYVVHTSVGPEWQLKFRLAYVIPRSRFEY